MGYGFTFSVASLENEKENLFSVVCSQKTSLYTVNNIYEVEFLCLNICIIDFLRVFCFAFSFIVNYSYVETLDN